ncbi:MAG: hypothetical protein J7L89_10250, partial [Bacteroidales bacterium]|nr:hypothetical protein [Bacteroidales bacterium]
MIYRLRRSGVLVKLPCGVYLSRGWYRVTRLRAYLYTEKYPELSYGEIKKYMILIINNQTIFSANHI